MCTMINLSTRMKITKENFKLPNFYLKTMQVWNWVIYDSLILRNEWNFAALRKISIRLIHGREKRGKLGEKTRRKKCTCSRCTSMHNKTTCYRVKSWFIRWKLVDLHFRVWWTFLFRGRKTGRRNNLSFLCAISRLCFMRYSFHYLHDKKSWNYLAHDSVILVVAAWNRKKTMSFWSFPLVRIIVKR